MKARKKRSRTWIRRGRSAAAVAALHEGRLGRRTPIPVRLPGGTLEISVDDELSVRMKGPAERVFEGDTSL